MSTTTSRESRAPRLKDPSSSMPSTTVLNRRHRSLRTRRDLRCRTKGTAGSAGRAAIPSREAIPMKPDPSAPGLCRQAMPAPKEGHRCRSGPITASPCRGVLGPRVELNHVWM